jgi:hypothetical protein
MSKTFGLYGSKAHPQPVPLSGQAGQQSSASTPWLTGSRSHNTVGPRRRHSSGANQSWILSTVNTLSVNDEVCYSEEIRWCNQDLLRAKCQRYFRCLPLTQSYLSAPILRWFPVTFKPRALFTRVGTAGRSWNCDRVHPRGGSQPRKHVS